MIHIYDGANVLLRDMTTKPLPGQNRLSIRKRFEAMATSAPGTQIWCFDGKGHNERRKAIYPKYKANREPMAEDHFAMIRLWKDVALHAGCILIECESWEADDIGATMARRLAAAGHRVTCYTNDLDWHQLTMIPTISINGIQKIPCEARWIPLYKALVGDSSDNIDGVKGFGPTTWRNLEPWWPDLEAGIVAGDPEAFLHIPMPKRCLPAFANEDLLGALQGMLTVTHMMTVPEEELGRGIKIGALNREAADALMTRYFL